MGDLRTRRRTYQICLNCLKVGQSKRASTHTKTPVPCKVQIEGEKSTPGLLHGRHRNIDLKMQQ